MRLLKPLILTSIAMLITLSPCARADTDVVSELGKDHRTNDPTVVKVEQGTLRGIDLGDGVIRYFGIPFAAPPVGPLRLKDPQPPAPYSGLYDASQPKSACFQGFSAAAPTGKEDCLYLNIYVPKTIASGEEPEAPVLFWIYGGGNTSGDAVSFSGAAVGYGSALALEQNAIVVTANYRLGALGWLAHPALSAETRPHRSGNYGLLDQQSAMAWVRRNISHFGGDSKNITLFGESSGGVNIYSNLASPTAAGLFDKALSSSGAIYPRQSTLAEAEAFGQSLAQSWGCSGAGPAAAECLRSLPASTFLTASVKPYGAFPAAFDPIIDGTILLESEPSAFASGRFNKVPFIAGSNRNEGTVFIIFSFSLFGETVPSTNFGEFAENYLSLSGAASGIEATYPLSDYENADEALAAALGDFHFTCSNLRLADAISKHEPHVFVYEFSDDPPAQSFVPHYPPVVPDLPDGVYHAADLSYWFDIYTGTVTDVNRSVGRQMRTYLGNFARTGNPNGEASPRWRPYNAHSRYVQNFASQFGRVDEFSEHRCGFWETQPLPASFIVDN